MSKPVISIEDLSKVYQLGIINTGTFRGDVQRWWARLRGVPDPYVKINEQNGAHQPGETLWALKNVSFQVEQGDVLGIVGRNGAGKSTLLKILSRVTAPTSGVAKVKGRIASLLEVGTGFHPELTGRENIYMNGAILGMSRDEIRRKFDEIVDFSGVEKFIDTPVKRYSSGMYVRLGFAIAAHLEPEILIVDEVLAVGDAQFQKKCLGKMGEVAKAGRTVLFVSHNMLAVRSLCARVIELEQGCIVNDGDTENVVKHYLQKETRSLMNQVWENPYTAPGNEKVRIHSARVKLLDQSENNQISIETPLEIEFQVWNNIPDAVINFNMHLLTIEGAYVLATASEAKPRHQGLVKVAVRLPANFLNSGTYRLNLQVVDTALSSTLYVHPDILVFEVLDVARDGHWFGKWPGVVRPKFEWCTEDIVSAGAEPWK
jgi:lipopolysaccharide transport system ATP-binding protein